MVVAPSKRGASSRVDDDRRRARWRGGDLAWVDDLVVVPPPGGGMGESGVDAEMEVARRRGRWLVSGARGTWRWAPGTGGRWARGDGYREGGWLLRACRRLGGLVPRVGVEHLARTRALSLLLLRGRAGRGDSRGRRRGREDGPTGEWRTAGGVLARGAGGPGRRGVGVGGGAGLSAWARSARGDRLAAGASAPRSLCSWSRGGRARGGRGLGAERGGDGVMAAGAGERRGRTGLGGNRPRGGGRRRRRQGGVGDQVVRVAIG